MKKHEHKGGLFSWGLDGDIAILRAERPVVEIGIDLDAKREFFRHFADAEQSSEIKALLLTHSSVALSDEEYRRFVLAAARTGEGGITHGPESDLPREEHALAQYVLMAATFKKLLISCLQGSVASAFFGAHLASDIRIVSEDFVVEMSHITLDTPPDGGLGFFLPRYVGQGRATKMLLSGKPLPAAEALDLGLVHAVVPGQDFEARCLETARGYINLSAGAISLTKEILNPFGEELRRYLQVEASVVLRALHSTEV